MKAALVIAKKANHDVFNCMDIMDNKVFIEVFEMVSIQQELKFGPGNGNLMFYFYNFIAPNMTPDQIGMVLV